MSSTTGTVLRISVLKSLTSIVYFPAWWYTRGFFRVLKGVGNSVATYNNSLGFTIWLKNIFTPLFGQSDIWGRILSFFLRFFNIIFRGLAFLFILVLHILFVLAWLLIPLIIIWQLAIH